MAKMMVVLPQVHIEPLIHVYIWSSQQILVWGNFLPTSYSEEVGMCA